MQNSFMYRAHPWHGVAVGDDAPEVVTCYIEMVPTDTVKFELDKESGILKVDRPQKYSSNCPAMYGFIPQTFCGDSVGELCAKSLRRKKMRGDRDPLDICVFADRTILHGDILVRARPVGGFKLVDRAEADDKIIAVLEGDGVYGDIHDLSDMPKATIDRLKHYFLTYKALPGTKGRPLVEVAHIYNRTMAHRVIRASIADYQRLTP